MSTPYAVVPSFRVSNWGIPSSQIKKLNQDFLFETNNKFGFPEIESYGGKLPEDLMGWDNPLTKRGGKKISHCWIHFNIDDRFFEDVWSQRTKILSVGQRFDGMLSTTYSIYEVQPYAMNLWNTYRNRWVTKFMQYHKINTIPCVLWADVSTYEYSFSALPKNSTLEISTVGTRIRANRKLFCDGFGEMIKTLSPNRLLVYGEYFPLTFTDYVEEVKIIPSDWAKKRERVNNKSIENKSLRGD